MDTELNKYMHSWTLILLHAMHIPSRGPTFWLEKRKTQLKCGPNFTWSSNLEVGSSPRLSETFEPIVQQFLSLQQHPAGCAVVLPWFGTGVEFSSTAGDGEDLDWVVVLALMVEEEKTS